MFGIKPKDKGNEVPPAQTPPVSSVASSQNPPMATPAATQPKKPGIFATLFPKKSGLVTPQPFIDPQTGVIQHSSVEKKFQRMRFMERHGYKGARAFIIVIAILFFVVAFYVGFLIVRALLPAPDADRDGVPDTQDACPGYDDAVDIDKDGIPDGCDPAVTPGNFNDITFTEPVLVTSDDKVYDVVFDIKDSNNTWGVTALKYKVEVLSASGEVLKSQTNVSYVPAAGTTTIVEPNIATSEKAVSARATLVSGTFAKNISSQNVTLTIRNKTFTPRTSDGTALFSGVLQNNSNFDLNLVNVTMVVKNASGKIVADHLTKIHTLLSSENRYFELRFPESLDPSVTYEVVATTDTMDQGNFLPKTGSGSQF